MELLITQLFNNPLSFAGFLIAITIGLTFHEAAHAWMATRLGDLTAKYAGRLSLNPSRHFDPAGFFMLIFVGFGWGRPVPVNPRALTGKYDELKVALAGPGANIIIAAICTLIVIIGYETGYPYETNPVMGIVRQILEINAVLAVFNLLPIFPLDGSAILRSLVSYRYQPLLDSYERNGLFILIGILLFESITKIPLLSTPIILGVRLILYLTHSFFYLFIEPIKMLFS